MEYRDSLTETAAAFSSSEDRVFHGLISLPFTRKRSRRTNFHAEARTRMIIRDGWPRELAREGQRKKRTRNIYIYALFRALSRRGKGERDPLYSSG